MTFKEFKELIEREHGRVVEQQYGFCIVRHDKTDVPIVLINLYKIHSIDTYFLTDDEDMRFMAYNWNTISEFVATPVEDRFHIQKYYVKLIAPRILSDDKIYLNKVVSNIEPTQKILYQLGHGYSKWKGRLNYISEFTMEEIEAIIPKEDMGKFKLIPVEEA